MIPRTLLIAVVGLLAVELPAHGQEISWSLGPTMPRVNSEFGAATIDGKIYASGRDFLQFSGLEAIDPPTAE